MNNVPNKILILIVFFLVLSIYLIYASNFNQLLLRYDSYVYLIKSLEITDGNLIPIKTHALGWPLATALFFYFFKSSSIFVNMIYAQFLSVFVNGLIIFPLYGICKKILDNKNTLLVLLIFPLSYWLMYSSSGFWTEPLFTFLLLVSLFYIYKSRENPNYILLAAAFASLSYWVRPNGLVILPVIILSHFFLEKNKKSWFFYAFLTAIVFFAISAPFLYQRYLYFGSPFFYGENSKYWADTYEQLLGANYSAFSFLDYLKTHSLPNITHRFIIGGLGALIFGLLAFSLPLTIFFLWGLFSSLKKVEFIPLVIFLAIWLISLAPIFSVFYTGRYLFPTIPIILIFTAAGLKATSSKLTNPNLFLALAIGLTAPFLLVGFVYPNYYYQNSSANYSEKLEFGRWVAANIKGKIAMGYDWDFIMMNLPDTQVGGRGLFNPIAPKSGIEIIYPGYFNNIDSAMKWFKKNKITHVIISQEPRTVHPPLRILPNVDKPDYLELIYSKFDDIYNWQVEVYKVNWKEYDKIKSHES